MYSPRVDHLLHYYHVRGVYGRASAFFVDSPIEGDDGTL